MKNNLDLILSLRVNPDSEASRLSSSPVQSSKRETSIFDFDLKSVKFGSDLPRGVITKTLTCPPRPTVTMCSLCCTGRR